MRHLKTGLATIIGAAALISVGCTERTQLRGFDNTSWAPYVSEYGPNTGVTGSAASPYVGGGVINKKADPAYNPAMDDMHRSDVRRDWDSDRDVTIRRDVDIDRDGDTTSTTTIRRD
jgi:hypothetical protein